MLSFNPKAGATISTEQAANCQSAADWWQGLLANIRFETMIDRAALFRAGPRPSRYVAQARRDLVRRAVRDIGPVAVKAWLNAVTIWSRKTIGSLIEECAE
jgi:hypothetical protein